MDQRFASLDLGDRVSRDESKLVGFGTYGIVYEGTLHPRQTKVAVKVVRCADKSTPSRPVLEVSSLYARLSVMLHNIFRNYSKKSMFGPNLTTKISLNYLGWHLLLSIIHYL